MFFVNNTTEGNLAEFGILKSLKEERKIPEDFEDIFTAEFLVVNGKERVLIDWVED